MLSVEPQRGIISMVVCCIASSRGILFSLFIGSIATEEDSLGVDGKAVREFGRILVLIARYTNIQLVWHSPRVGDYVISSLHCSKI